MLSLIPFLGFRFTKKHIFKQYLFILFLKIKKKNSQHIICNPCRNGAYGDDGHWYDEHGQKGYFDEDGVWYDYIDEIGFYDNDGEWQEYDYSKGYWGDDGNWHDMSDSEIARQAQEKNDHNNKAGHFLWVSEERIKPNYSNDQVLSSELNHSMVIGRLSSGLDEDKSSETLTNSVHNSQDLSYSIESDRTGVGGVAGGGKGVGGVPPMAAKRISGATISNRSSLRSIIQPETGSNRSSISSHPDVRTDKNCNIYSNGENNGYGNNYHRNELQQQDTFSDDQLQSPLSDHDNYNYNEKDEDLYNEEEARDVIGERLEGEGQEDEVDQATARPKLSSTNRWSMLARGTSLGLFDLVRII